jgi:hypothetical protein
MTQQVQQQESVRILVEIQNEETERLTKQAFNGRWLFQDTFDSGNFGLIKTAKGNLVVLRGPADDRYQSWESYDDFDQIKEEDLPEDFIAAVAEELGVEYVIENYDV